VYQCDVKPVESTLDYLQWFSEFIVRMYHTAGSESVYVSWLGAVLGTMMVGMSGLVPMLIIPLEAGQNLKSEEGSRTLRLLLSFAVGGLLGDVFLHLFPESYGALSTSGKNTHTGHLVMGLWILGGILTFLVLEKIFEFTDQDETENNNKGDEKRKKIVGYLNLLANCIDNFIHGLAVASSFLTSFKMGLITTFAILIHEIPHEIGDFAILLKSGFSRWEAGKAQMWTASVGMLGAIAALSLDSVQSLEARTSWILPFSAGGFLNIALVSVLPELMSETDPKEAMKQLGCIFLGIFIMAILSFL